MAISFDNQTPIYVQIMDEIKRGIILGKYTAGQKLPSVREFAMQFNVNPNTIQKALFELEWVGLIVTERTNGKYVTKDQNVLSNLKYSMVDKIIENYFNSMQKIGIDRTQAIKLINVDKEQV